MNPTPRRIADRIRWITLSLGLLVTLAGAWHNLVGRRGYYEPEELDAAIGVLIAYASPYVCYLVAWNWSKEKTPTHLAIAAAVSGIALVGTSAWLYWFHTVSLSRATSSTAGIAALGIVAIQVAIAAPIGFLVTPRK